MAFEKNMGENSNSKHIDLNEDPTFIPRTISDILKNVSCSENPSEIDSHLQLYENELRKVDAFKRELPLCMQLLKDGIEKLKEERLQFKAKGKKPIITEEDDELAKMPIGKRTYVSSFQQYFSSSMCNEEEQLGSGGAFVAFNKEPPTSGVTAGAEDEEAISGGLIKPPKKQKKTERRCWSPELHGLFVDAVHQIGGAQVATPRRIIEKMKIEGLTNDEVKSHLQKYRIHIRRLASASSNSPWLANEEVSDNDDYNYMQEKEVVKSKGWGKQVNPRY